LKRQIVISFYQATLHSPPGALFETRGVTSDTAIAVGMEHGERQLAAGRRNMSVLGSSSGDNFVLRSLLRSPLKTDNMAE
jgi:hypothetical protein